MMHGLLQYEDLLFYIQSVALIGVAVRFVTSGLQRIYRYFFVYVMVQIFQSLLFLILVRDTNLYGYLFEATEGVVILLYALIVLELYSVVLSGLKGIRTLAQRYIKVSISIAIVVGLLLLGLERVPASILDRFYTFESVIVSSLVLFVFLITVFLVYYPIPLNRNVIYYSIGYAVYFTAKAMALFLRNTGNGLDRVFSFWMLVVSTGCLLFWILSLSAKGERKTVVFGHKWDPGDEQRLMQQLEALDRGIFGTRNNLP